ncbi:MAG: YbhB/YbcL family Raf kinase inhibitor-like protein [Candidatus Zambryskibacteria bacterium]|nr:YbhB/YbcL family Raf kinase inhibitor-like protein [Candidatus Zambryskibacteria bacterium]
MELKSSVFENGGVISSKYTCDGQNIHPPLDISGVPSEVKSLVIIMDDHDVPRNIRPDGVWDHWVVFNIPPTLSTINEAEKIAGVYGKNSGGKTEYTGPCPPDREHRYIFYLYALDIELPLEIGATKTQVLNAMTGHILSEARLTGRYDRINRR